ncbi:MAG: hypothetical protein VB051_05535 [Candidatus Pelethousia sp.]|nr:hypothetical protein [Candidatus Pelethousia sp.]
MLFWIIYIIFLVSQGFIAYRFIHMGNMLYLKAILASNTLFALYVIAEAIFKINVPPLLRILVIGVLFVQNYFGYFKDRFIHSKVFDRYLHIFGTTVFTLFLYNILILLVHPYMYPKIIEAVFVFTFGIAVGALFEVFEFSGDQLMHESVKMQKGLKDTNVDLICNSLGSLIAAIIAYSFIL